MITERQQKILNLLIKEYIDGAEPVSSNLLQKRSNLGISPATIRNDLHALTIHGYIEQPHTSAGRVPTEKGYRFFIEITFSGQNNRLPDFLIKEIENAKSKIESELRLAQELTKTLKDLSSLLRFSNGTEEESLFDILKIVGPSRTTHQKNIDLMKELIDEFENL